MSSSLVAQLPTGPEEVAERAPTDWRTGSMQRRIRQRYAAERRFRAMGLAAVVMSAGFLAFLLITMLANGLGGFTQTEIKLRMDFPRAGLTLDPARLAGPGADFALAAAGIERATDAAANAQFGPDGYRMLSDGAWLRVREAVKADPTLLRGASIINVPASDAIDVAAKSDGTPEAEAIVTRLKAQGVISTGFNPGFLTSSDSTDPTTVGIWGALKGSLFTMVVTLLIAFPVGVRSALYL